MDNKMDNKKIITYGVIGVLILIAIIGFTSSNDTTTPTTEEMLNGKVDYNEEYVLERLNFVYLEETDEVIFEAHYIGNGQDRFEDYTIKEDDITYIFMEYDEDLEIDEYKFIHESTRYSANEPYRIIWNFKSGNEKLVNEYNAMKLDMENIDTYQLKEDGDLQLNIFSTLFYDNHEFKGDFMILNEEGVYNVNE